jgi:hypothetical protein
MEKWRSKAMFKPLQSQTYSPAFCPYQELPLSNAQALCNGQKLV